MNLRLDPLQLDGVAEPMPVKGTEILTQTQRINVSSGDRGPLVLGNSGGTVTFNDNLTRHEDRILYSPNSSPPQLLSPSEPLVDNPDCPGNSLPRVIAISESCLQSGMPPPPPSNPPALHAEEQNMDAKSLTLRLIEALHPVVLQNVQLRSLDKMLIPRGVQDGTKSLLTDEFCGSFVEKMRSVQQQIQALKTDGPPGHFAGASLGTGRTNGLDTNPSGSKSSEDVPMSTFEPVASTSTSQSVTQPENQMPASYLPMPPASGSYLNVPRAPKAMLARENGWSITVSTVRRSKSPPYYPSRKGKDREYENASRERHDELPSQHAHPPDVRDYTPESRGIPIPMDPDFFSTPSSSAREGTRLTGSPSPSRSWRYSRPGNVSTSCNYPPSDRRSPSPYHRPPSPHRHRLPPPSYRHRSPTPDRRSSFRRHRSPSPYSPPQYPSRDGGVHSTDQSFSHGSQNSPLKLNGLQNSPLKLNGSRQYVPRSRSRSLSRPRYPIDRAPDATSHTNGRNHTSYDGSKDHPILSLPRPPLDTLPVATQEGRQSPTNSANSVQPANGTRGILKPCHNIPGLWFAKTGHDGASVVECEFEVDKETAVKWDLNDKPLQSSQLLPDYTTKICLQLLCLQSDLVKSVYKTSNLGAATPEDVATAFSNIKTEWPVQGSLVVEVNSNKSYGKTWLPRHLTQTHPPLDLTGYVREGINVVRLIQLAGLEDKVFVLHAMPSSMDSLDSEAEQEIIDWADHVQHAPFGKQSAPVEITHRDNTLE